MTINRREVLRAGVGVAAGAIASKVLVQGGLAAEAAASGGPFTLPKLPYAYDALEPYIDARTMEIHHDKHHATYVDNLNKALATHPEMQKKRAVMLLQEVNQVPADVRQAVINNGGGHVNHTLFWQMMGPKAGGAPNGDVAKAIDGAFGSFDKFKAQFGEAALKRFGSGWAWLIAAPGGKVEVISTGNQDSPYMQGQRPLLGLDVWEHAYYLKYQNKRADYIQAWWNVVNWDFVNSLYAQIRARRGAAPGLSRSSGSMPMRLTADHSRKETTHAPVEVTLRIPGSWSGPAEFADRLPRGCRCTETHLVLADGSEFELHALPADEQFPRIFAGSCPKLPTEDEREQIENYEVNICLSGACGSIAAAKRLMAAAAAVLAAGGAGVFVDNSGIAHGATDWRELLDSADDGGVYWAFISTVRGDSEMYSVGMHILGFRDAVIPVTGNDEYDHRTLHSFLGYTAFSGAAIQDGEFVGDAVLPCFRVHQQPDDRVPGNAPMFNPFGRWRLVKADAQRN